MAHIILLGDSIFDNKAYVGSEPDVVSHLRAMIPQNWRASLKAVDGSLVENVSRQTIEIPPDATHLLISAGGNNALMNSDVLSLKVDSSAEAFNILANRADDFERHYHEMLKTVSDHNLPIAVCTIYYPNFFDPVLQKIAVAALSAFNDAIIRQAVLFGLPFLDLRSICGEKDDYANEIEPSGKGGLKIAAKIYELVETHDFSYRRTIVYA